MGKIKLLRNVEYVNWAGSFQEGAPFVGIIPHEFFMIGSFLIHRSIENTSTSEMCI